MFIDSEKRLKQLSDEAKKNTEDLEEAKNIFLMIRRPPRSTLDRSSAASDVYKRQEKHRWQSRRKEEFKVYTGIPKRLGTCSRAAEG